MKRVLVIGQVVVDEIVVDEDLSLDEQEPAAIRFGGKGFNIACALAQFGVKVDFLSAIGQDDAGIEIKSALVNHGVGSGLIVHATRGGRVAARTPRVRLNEGRHGERDAVEDTQPQMGHYYGVALNRPTDAQLQQFDGVIYTLEFGERLLPQIAELLRRLPTSALRVAHPAPRPTADHPRVEVSEVLGGADIIVPNRYEARFLVGKSVLPPQDLARRVAAVYHCGMAAVTLGREGWAWSESGESGVGSLPPVAATEKVGASDVFTAAVTWARLSGLRVEDACYIAGVAAALAVGRVGGVERFPNRKEVLSHLHEHEATASLDASDL